MNHLKRFEEKTEEIKKRGYYPNIPIVEGTAVDKKIHIEDKDYLLFSSNNYLGLSIHPEVKDAIKKAIDKYGMGSGGSRLMAGNTDIHNQLERNIAKFVGREDAITFNAGFMANVGVIPALVNTPVANAKDFAIRYVKKKSFFLKKTHTLTILSDEKNHGSIIDGIRLSSAERLIYKHKNIEDLERLIKGAKGQYKLIVTDGVFSMDGDIAPLPQIVQIAKKYGSMLMVDDAHGIGTLGLNGRGSIEHLGIADSDVDILMGTFTKAFGGIGGFVAGRKAFIDYLRISARTYILSAPLPPAIAVGIDKSIELAQKEGWRREKAWDNANYFRNKVQQLGYSTLESETLIVPVVFGDEKKVIQATEELFKMGIVAPNVRFPAVPLGQGLLRFAMSAMHDKEDLDYLLKCLLELRKSLKL